MKKEKKTYIDIIKQIADRDYGKEVLFYHGDGEWYSRDLCRNISLVELSEYMLKITNKDDVE